MTAPPFVSPAAAPPRPRGWWGIAALLLAAAFTLRAAQFWNPINGPDEQFYVLVGSRMLDGAIPYVDLWDRKPWGLFALFAGFRILGGDTMLLAKIAATLFAAATALIITDIAARFASRWAALLSGIFYLVMLHQLWGGGPQAPVFYNLWTAAAFRLVIDTDPALDARGDRFRVLAAMLLSGLAIQLKTNAVFEGIPLGVWMAWRMVHAHTPARRVVAMTGAMALAGLAPTLGVMLGYAVIGRFDAWWFANVVSQFLKHGLLLESARIRLGEFVAVVGPAVVLGLYGAVRGTGARWVCDRPLLSLWFGAAVIDALALGGFWGRYAIPLLVPASILAVHVFSLARVGPIVFAAVALFPALDATVLDSIGARDDAAIAAATTAAIPPDAATRCLYIYEGPSAYYELRHACLVTRYVFPDHLRSSAEAPALGENAETALRSALARAPGTIVTIEGSEQPQRNAANAAILAADLAAHYHPIARLPHLHNLRGREWLIVWRRNRAR